MPDWEAMANTAIRYDIEELMEWKIDLAIEDYEFLKKLYDSEEYLTKDEIKQVGELMLKYDNLVGDDWDG